MKDKDKYIEMIINTLYEKDDKKTSSDNIGNIMYKTLYEKSPFGIALIDSLNGKIYKANQKYKDMVAIDFDKDLNIDWMSITHPDDIQEDLDNMEKLNAGIIDGFQMQKRYIRSDGTYIWINMTIIPIIIDGIKLSQHLCVTEEITEKVKTFNNLKNALENDTLTGLHSRKYFEEKFEQKGRGSNYPISIILGNINGLKLYNDTFGHNLGDKEIIRIGNRIKEFITTDMLVARVSGDEFAIMIIEVEEEKIKEFMNNLYDYVNHSDQFIPASSLTISFGYSIQKTINDNLNMLYREAELHLYNKKYINNKSTRSSAINLIMEALFEKSKRERLHSQRVGDLSEKIAAAMNFNNQDLNKIRIAGYLHDIGKIGIDDYLLNKKGSLDKNEWEAIRLHPVKGAKILAKSIEYSQLTDIVISHHERYDGNGYPNGLTGDKIPIESRIICIADAYDAMTQKRPYKESISHQKAIEEIQKCAGEQFDPVIVKFLIENSDSIFANINRNNLEKE